MVARTEELIKEKYESMGYDVIRLGKPDLILLQDGIIEFIEVKTPGDKIKKHQQEAIDLLLAHGYKTRIEVADQDTLPIPFISKTDQLKVIVQCGNGKLSPREIYNIIIRTQRYPELKNFTQLLIAFFNDVNDDESLSFS